VDEQVETALGPVDGGRRPLAEPVGHADRADILGVDEADDALEAERLEPVRERRGSRLRRVPASPQLGVDTPTELRVVGPESVDARPRMADETRAFALLHGPPAEPVLDPVQLQALEPLGRLLLRHRPAEAAEVARVAAVRVEAPQIRHVVVAPASEAEPRRQELVHYGAKSLRS
jgi:hypothetical protein